MISCQSYAPVIKLNDEFFYVVPGQTNCPEFKMIEDVSVYYVMSDRYLEHLFDMKLSPEASRRAE